VRSLQRRKTAPPARVPGGGIFLACALRCWAFGYFGRRARALEEMCPQKSAAKSAGLHLHQILNKLAKFAKQLCSSSSPSVRHVSRTQGQLLARHEGRKQHRASVGGGYSLVTAECVRRWCMVRDTAEELFEIRCHLNLLPT
jgi:hypothetical protein